MAKPYIKSLFIFRRDLRLHDNSALIEALKQSESVMPIFIFDDRQIGDKNQYRSTHAIQFMIESIKDLFMDLKDHNGILFLFEGTAETVIKNIIIKESINAVFINQDYTPFSIQRDATIETVCLESKISFHRYHDALLNSPDTIQTKTGTPYSVFTPFFRACSKILVKQPAHVPSYNFMLTCASTHIPLSTFEKKTTKNNIIFPLDGGRKKGLHFLKNISHFKNYDKDRNFPFKDTTRLSAHHKFGTISIRESYSAIINGLGAEHTLIKQLYWRDFFYHIAYHHPYVFGHAYNKKYEHIWWSTNKSHFLAWCNGVTGFPIIDAGMRELNATGFMHNRTRMIVASFLTKSLHIHWLWGERYFAQKLTDYDPCVNNGNWQWAASTGSDAQPYFRIFNPWLQQKKYDPDCIYIKKWIPELKTITPAAIHSWDKKNSSLVSEYPRPIIDHTTESKITKHIFKNQQTQSPYKPV
ncbi:MAG: deoxyribodipyrimidine photo-lyase [Candidatus Dependentiae bacterium]|nr:deoxyribodipyrimidine photo-lyase [Candidatus Dependentiae bacterium]